MYCLLCRKHDMSNKFNKFKTFNADPSIRYRKPTLLEHCSSQQHRDAVTTEHVQRISCFHKEVVSRENTADSVLFKVFMSIYWLAKQEISNRKLLSLLALIQILGVKEMQYFKYKSEGAIQEMFLTIGKVILDTIVQKLVRANYIGTLCDDVTDVAVMEQFINFVQFVDPDTYELETDFLFVENVLEKSDSADAKTLFTVLCDKLKSFGISIDKLSSLVSDGASVMLGNRSGLAVRLKELNPKREQTPGCYSSHLDSPTFYWSTFIQVFLCHPVSTS